MLKTKHQRHAYTFPVPSLKVLFACCYVCYLASIGCNQLPLVLALSSTKHTRQSTGTNNHKNDVAIDRRRILQQSIKFGGGMGMGSIFASVINPSIAIANGTGLEETEESSNSGGIKKLYAYELRDRNKNKDAVIRDDIWWFTGQNPPRKLDLSNLPPGKNF